MNRSIIQVLLPKIALSIFIAGSMCQLSYAAIPFLKSKGIHTAIKPQLAHFSPILGFTAWETDYTKFLHKFSDHPLVTELFVIMPDGISFDITNLTSKPGKYLTPAAIGKILRVLETENSNSLQKTLEQIITQEIDLDKQSKTLTPQLQLCITKAFNDLTQLSIQSQLSIPSNPLEKNYLWIKKFAKYWTEKLQKYTQQITAKENEIVTLKHDLESAAETKKKNIAQKITNIQHEITELKHIGAHEQEYRKALDITKNAEKQIATLDLSPDKISKLAMAIIEAVKKSTGPDAVYPSYFIHLIFMTYLWRKVLQKEEFIEYFSALGKPFLTNPEILDPTSQAYRDFLAASYDTAEVDAVALSATTLDDFEKTTISLGYQQNTRPYPKILSVVGSTTYTNPKTGEVSDPFANCGETTVHNFFDFITFNPAKKKFDVSKLLNNPNIHCTKELIEFFEKHFALDTAQSSYNAWNQVVCGLDNVMYNNTKQKCDINSKQALSNILCIFGELLFSHNPSYKQKTNKEKLDYLVKVFTTPEFKLSWTIKDSDDEQRDDTHEIENNNVESNDNKNEQDALDLETVNRKEFIVLTFTITTPESTYNFDWKFDNKHFVIYPIKDSKKYDAIISLQDIALKLIEGTSVNNSNALCLPIVLSSWHRQKWEHEKFDAVLSNADKIATVFAQDLDNHDEKLIAIEDLLALTNPSYNYLISRLIKALPEEDIHFQSGIVKALIEHNQLELLKQFFSPNSLEASELKKTAYVGGILDCYQLLVENNENSQSIKNFMKQALQLSEGIKDHENIIDICFTIVGQIDDTQEPFSQQWYSWTKTKIPNINDTKNLELLFSFVSNNKRASLYPVVTECMMKLKTDFGIADQFVYQRATFVIDFLAQNLSFINEESALKILAAMHCHSSIEGEPLYSKDQLTQYAGFEYALAQKLTNAIYSFQNPYQSLLSNIKNLCQEIEMWNNIGFLLFEKLDHLDFRFSEHTAERLIFGCPEIKRAEFYPVIEQLIHKICERRSLPNYKDLNERSNDYTGRSSTHFGNSTPTIPQLIHNLSTHNYPTDFIDKLIQKYSSTFATENVNISLGRVNKLIRTLNMDSKESDEKKGILNQIIQLIDKLGSSLYGLDLELSTTNKLALFIALSDHYINNPKQFIKLINYVRYGKDKAIFNYLLTKIIEKPELIKHQEIGILIVEIIRDIICLKNEELYDLATTLIDSIEEPLIFAKLVDSVKYKTDSPLLNYLFEKIIQKPQLLKNNEIQIQIKDFIYDTVVIHKTKETYNLAKKLLYHLPASNIKFELLQSISLFNDRSNFMEQSELDKLQEEVSQQLQLQ